VVDSEGGFLIPAPSRDTRLGHRWDSATLHKSRSPLTIGSGTGPRNNGASNKRPPEAPAAWR
jgi:hypothetical protein